MKKFIYQYITDNIQKTNHLPNKSIGFNAVSTKNFIYESIPLEESCQEERLLSMKKQVNEISGSEVKRSEPLPQLSLIPTVASITIPIRHIPSQSKSSNPIALIPKKPNIKISSNNRNTKVARKLVSKV